MEKVKILIVGGNTDTGKMSSVLNEMSNEFIEKADGDLKICNGVLPKDSDISGRDLIIWMPDISNEKPKNYPVKDKGAVLICSKVIREGYSEVDAVSRIFKMNGNAVIAIYKEKEKLYRFELIDALGNKWISTTEISHLVVEIERFYEWSKTQIRISYTPCDNLRNITFSLDEMDRIDRFMRLNTLVADKVENRLGSRYFGNFSTRCMKLFPSMRVEGINSYSDVFLFSPRNVDKRRLTINDFVIVMPPYYYDNFGRKYSVDSPIQAHIYNTYPGINYMIHGHAFIENAPTTDKYFPCGDMREADEIVKLLGKDWWRRGINLKNHGFLLMAHDLDEMKKYINEFNFRLVSALDKECDNNGKQDR